MAPEAASKARTSTGSSSASAGAAPAAPAAGPASAPASSSASTSTAAPPASSGIIYSIGDLLSRPFQQRTAPAPDPTTASASASSSSGKQPAKKKVRIASPKGPRKAPASSKKKTPSASSSTPRASSTTAARPASSLSLPIASHPLAAITERDPSACTSYDTAAEAAKYLEAKLCTHDSQGCPEMMLHHIVGARPHTSFRKRTRASAAALAAGEGHGDEYDEFAEMRENDDSTDDDNDDPMSDEDDEQGGAAALLLLGQTPSEQPEKDEYGRRAVKAANVVELLRARRAWLVERKRLLEKIVAFWQRADILDNGKRFEAALKIAHHTIELVKTFSLPQEGLALLLAAQRGLIAAMPRAKQSLPSSSAGHPQWESLTRAFKSYATHYQGCTTLAQHLSPPHFDLLRTIGDVNHHLAIMRQHFREHLKDSADKITRFVPSPYAYTGSHMHEEEVRPTTMLMASSAYKSFFVDLLAYAVGADVRLYQTRSRERQSSKEGHSQKTLPISTTAEPSSSFQVTITPGMVLRELAAMHEPSLADFKLSFRELHSDVNARAAHLTNYHKMPMMMGVEYQQYAIAERSLRYCKLVDRAQKQEEEVQKAWSELESVEIRRVHAGAARFDIDDTAIALLAGRRKVRDALATSRATQARVLAEARMLLSQGLTTDSLLGGGTSGGAVRAGPGAKLGPGVGTSAQGRAAPAATPPLAIIPQVINLASDVRSQIFDLDGRVKALMDLARCVIRFVRWRFLELSRIAKPAIDPFGSESTLDSPWGSTAARQAAVSMSLGNNLRRGFVATNEQMLDAAQRFWEMARCALDLLHAALDRLTGAEYVDLDEVSDLERMLIQAERGQREWSDKVALTSEPARLRLRLANQIVEVRLAMANEVLFPFLGRLEWDAERLDLWRPQGFTPSRGFLGADTRSRLHRKATMPETVTYLREGQSSMDMDGADSTGQGAEAAALSADEEKALAYLRHQFLVNVTFDSSAAALRLAGFEWMNWLQTTAPFSRFRAEASLDTASRSKQDEERTRNAALQEVKWDVMLSQARDDWHTSAYRAEAVVLGLRAGFAYWRAAAENLSRIAATGGDEDVPVHPDIKLKSRHQRMIRLDQYYDKWDPARPSLTFWEHEQMDVEELDAMIAQMGARLRQGGAGAGGTSSGGSGGSSGPKFSPSLMLPAHSFLPVENSMILRSAYWMSEVFFMGDEYRQEQLGSRVLGFRTLIDAPGLEKLANRSGGSFSHGRGLAGGGSGPIDHHALAKAAQAQLLGLSPPAATAAATASGSARTASASGAKAGARYSAAAASSSSSSSKKRDKGKQKEDRSRARGGTSNVDLSRLPRTSKAWKMHMLAFHDCREAETKYLIGTNTTPEPYMNEIRKLLALRTQTAAIVPQATVEGPFGGAPTYTSAAAAAVAAGGTAAPRSGTKKTLVIRSEAEERWGELAVGYRERCFWMEVVRATLGGSTVALA